ncbi:hypothetical protein EJ04DRAFT_194895 [Polyplosphaeria fusca]|uniref:Uncharacterized protein n=1 Tax=Polyplosphaeria fusca TaxID=682080 RepID=A0A9P4V4L4_9PLEO|nr:hypothetical protein EJ04DRAFT_194895 [Polyplosphaeria fusca]
MELQEQDIDKSALQKHHGLIKEWLETVILPIDEEDEENEEEKKKDTTPGEQPSQAQKASEKEQYSDQITTFASTSRASKGTTTTATNRQRSSPKIENVMLVRRQKNATENAPTTPIEPAADDDVTLNDIPRRSSAETHRSQKDEWINEEISDTKQYAVTMICKILRSKYPTSSGTAPYRLPLIRAFHHVDLIRRG